MRMTIGSGDVGNLLAGYDTKAYASLWAKFVDPFPPNYNSYASPLDALRTGAILEDNFMNVLPEGWYSQIKATASPWDCMTASLDFAKMMGGKPVEFIELKTMWLTDYIDIVIPMLDMAPEELQAFVHKKFKGIYRQIQFQLICTELEFATLAFLGVDTYDDEENQLREIREQDYKMFQIGRDPAVMREIVERVRVFQNVKDSVKQ